MTTKLEADKKLFVNLDTNDGIKFISKTSIAMIEELDSSKVSYRFGLLLKEKRPNGQTIYFKFNTELMSDVWDMLKDIES